MTFYNGNPDGIYKFRNTISTINYIPNKDAAGMLLDLHMKSKFQWESINHLFCRKVLFLVGSFVLLASIFNSHHGQ
jgi:hypothetical protein